MERKPTSAVAAGAVISLVLVIIALVTYFTGLYTQTWAQYVALVVLVGGLIWAVRNHGREVGYTDSFGKLFSYGFRATAVIVCLMIVYTFLSGALFPEIKRNIIENAKMQQLQKPNANEAAIEQNMKMFEDHYNLFIVLGILFWYLIVGSLASLVGAMLTKKNDPQTFDKI